MIQVLTVIDRLKADLDSEGTDYWTFDRDFKPAINDGVAYLVSLINSIEGSNKFANEFFRDLTYTKVVIPTVLNRFFFDYASIGNFDVWSILSIMPRATVTPSGTPVSTDLPQYPSQTRFVTSDYSCKRLTTEEWYNNKNNPFMAGNTVQNMNAPELVEYAYLGFSDYFVNAKKEIEIRPSVVNTYVGVTYVVTPNPIAFDYEAIPFPTAATDLVVRATLRSLSIKMGGQKNDLYEISSTDLKTLFQSIS